MIKISALREECTRAGFDLCDPIHTKWYNDLIEKEGHVAKGTLQKIPEPPTIVEGDGDGVTQHKFNAVLIGNSKAVWPKFIDWVSSQYEMKLSQARVSSGDNGDGRSENKDEILNQVLNDNPFDTFVTDTLSQVFQSCFTGKSQDSKNTDTGTSETSKVQLSSYEFFWSNGINYKISIEHSSTDQESIKKDNDTGDYHCYAENENSEGNKSFLVSMQRAAKITGKYWHDEEGTKLCVHPVFGTWKAFRAVVVFHHKTNELNNLEPSNSKKISTVPEAPPVCPCPVNPEEIQKAKEVMDYALKVSTAPGESTTTGYGGGLCNYLHNSVTSGSEWSKVSPTMRPWIQLRDCISVGREDYKYSDNQLLYHYTKDVEILKNELNI